MVREDQEWDDIHFGKEEVIIPDPNAIPVDDIPERTFASDEDIEDSAAKTKGEDDDLPLVPKTVDTEGAPAAEPEPPVSENVSGIEMYLAAFDIEAGMIQFEDGTSTHFNDLDAAKQAEILQQLHATQAVTTESQYGLDDNEIGLINYLRTNNLSVEDMVEQMVNERVSTMMTMQDLATEDYAKMDADAIYVKFLKETSPEATPEQIAADLTKAKELSNYAKQAEALRAQYTAKQEALVATKSGEAKAAQTALVESQRQEIVQAVLPMTEIAGITLDTNIKNTVLDHILETNEEGDSAFMDEVFADPKSLFNAAFWTIYGPSLIQQRDEYWKKEKSAAYKRGKEDALGTNTQTQGRSFTAKPAAQPHTNRTGAAPKETSDSSWEDLHN